MYRLLLVCGAVCCLPACVPAPGSPSLLETPVTGNWTGTFESSWGALPITATLANIEGSQSISGSYAVDGQRATGTVGGALQTHDKDTPGLFHGSLTISYLTPAGETCRSTSAVTSGSATATWFTLSSTSFVAGNCPDAPTNIKITLRR